MAAAKTKSPSNALGDVGHSLQTFDLLELQHYTQEKLNPHQEDSEQQRAWAAVEGRRKRRSGETRAQGRGAEKVRVDFGGVAPPLRAEFPGPPVVAPHPPIRLLDDRRRSRQRNRARAV